MSSDDNPMEVKDPVYYFRCESCKSDIFWSDIRPSVQRAARVFKWVRAGCPNENCEHHLTLSQPDKIYGRNEAQEIFNDLISRGIKAFWV